MPKALSSNYSWWAGSHPGWWQVCLPQISTGLVFWTHQLSLGSALQKICTSLNKDNYGRVCSIPSTKCEGSSCMQPRCHYTRAFSVLRVYYILFLRAGYDTLLNLRTLPHAWGNEYHVQKVKLISEKPIQAQDKCICKWDAINRILIVCICIYFILHYENQRVNHKN